MGVSKAQKAMILDRRRQVSSLYLGCVRKGDIAKRLGVDPDTITRDVKALELEWIKERRDNPVALRARELAALDEMERIAWQHYTGYNTFVDGKVIRIAGDGRWWDRILKCMKRRAKLLGLDFWEPVPGSTPDVPLHLNVGYDINNVELTNEEVEFILELDRRLRLGRDRRI